VLRIDLLTLFPEPCRAFLEASIVGRAQQNGLVQIVYTDIRNYAADKHRSVDDKPFGGGPGMVMLCQPVFDAVEAVERMDPRPAQRVLLTPQGEPFTQRMAGEFAKADRLLLICGHYEGLDERIIEGLQPREVSIGDYVLSGGEPAAMVLIDAVVRLLPGALGGEQSAEEESFSNGLLEYPQYTRPREFRGMTVPEVLISGDHQRVAEWRRQQALQRTRRRRPDLLDKHERRRDGSCC
jgi:tRNA (guanine37-N1)-methyltransferase